MFSDPNTEITTAYTLQALASRRRSGRDERCTARRAATAGWATTQVICSDPPSCAARVLATGDLQGQPVLHNNTALPKAFSQCHSSEFRRVKPAGEEGRREQTQREVTKTKHEAGSLASQLVISDLNWLILQRPSLVPLQNMTFCVPWEPARNSLLQPVTCFHLSSHLVVKGSIINKKKIKAGKETMHTPRNPQYQGYQDQDRACRDRDNDKIKTDDVKTGPS